MSAFSCPSCGTTLLVLSKPCHGCGLIFIQGSVICPSCKLEERLHLRTCPPKPSIKILCPLCGGLRHRHDTVASKHECQWNQCFGPTKVKESVATLHVFQNWLEKHDDDLSGYWESEKEMRKRGLL